MGCGDACPIFPGKRYESWDNIDDPADLRTPAVRPIRDDIERRVRQLTDELGLTSTADQSLGRRYRRAHRPSPIPVVDSKSLPFGGSFWTSSRGLDQLDQMDAVARWGAVH
jgi:hypothetical protein